MRKEQEKARKEKQQAEVAAQKAVAEAKPAPKPAPVAQPAQLRKHKIHVVKRHVQINHVIIVARMKMDLSKQEIISGIIKTK